MRRKMADHRCRNYICWVQWFAAINLKILHDYTILSTLLSGHQWLVPWSQFSEVTNDMCPGNNSLRSPTTQTLVNTHPLSLTFLDPSAALHIADPILLLETSSLLGFQDTTGFLPHSFLLLVHHPLCQLLISLTYKLQDTQYLVLFYLC